MQNVQRLESTIPFNVIDDLGNGWYYYNYDRNSYEVPTVDMDGNESIETRYSCIQIKLNSKPTYKNCVEAIIRKHLSASEEFDLINSVSESEKDAQKYQDYLQLRNEIKAKIKVDFNE